MEESNKQPEKMSYEQLENIAHQLSEQNRQMYQQLQQANMTNVFKRLDYLFKVVENASHFTKDFYSNCIKEIESIMTITEEENKDS